MALKLFHVSEEPGIEIFLPRPSPSVFDAIHGNVVFAINEVLLHNYLLPRNCPRVTFYAKCDSREQDVQKYIGTGNAKFVIAVEQAWFERIKNTRLYSYEFAPDNFNVLDEGAGYYISYRAVKPIKVHQIHSPFDELHKRNVELRFMAALWPLARQIEASSLQFSLIRMRNALAY